MKKVEIRWIKIRIHKKRLNLIFDLNWVYLSGKLGIILNYNNNYMITNDSLKESYYLNNNYKLIIGRIKKELYGIQYGYFFIIEYKGLYYESYKIKNNIIFKLGYSVLILFNLKMNRIICNNFRKHNKLIILGLGRDELGVLKEKIKLIRKPDIYKGKGVRLEGEILKLKVGKKR